MFRATTVDFARFFRLPLGLPDVPFFGLFVPRPGETFSGTPFVPFFHGRLKFLENPCYVNVNVNHNFLTWLK